MKLPLNKKMSNEELKEVFSFISQVLGMDEQNRYRARAYEEAADIVHHLDYQLLDRFQDLHQEHELELADKKFHKQLEKLPGIGEAIADKLVELFSTGNIKAFQKYVKDMPGGMYPLVQLHGIGAKKGYKLAKQFNLNNPQTAIAELLTKAKHGQVQGLTGFGEKSERQLIAALEKQHQKARIPHDEAVRVAKQLEKVIRGEKSVKKVICLGSLRRGEKTVGDIDLGVATNDPKAVVSHVIDNLKILKRVLVAGENLLSVVVTNEWQADIKFTNEQEWGSFIQHFTGSKQHNIKLREYAMKKGLSLSEHGIKIKETDQLKKFADEEEFYKFLGFKHIPPKERTGGDELDKYSLK
jgi:DNA polymerase (family 10)